MCWDHSTTCSTHLPGCIHFTEVTPLIWFLTDLASSSKHADVTNRFMGVGIVDDFSWRLTRRQNGAATFPPDSSTLNKTSVLLLYSGDLNTNNLNSGNIWIPNFLKFGFQMVQYSNGQSIGYALCLRPHSNTGPVHKKTRWHPFVQYSHSWAFRYSNGIQKPDHLASDLFSTIWIPN